MRGSLTQRQELLAAQPAPVPVVPPEGLEPWPDNDPEEEPAPAPPAQPLLEASASVNCHTTVAGRQVQLTLRDHDEGRLLERLQKILERFPVEAKPQPQDRGKDWCTVHNVPMKQTTKNGRSWFSHYQDGQWCKGR